jgi:aspartyl-tRNA(Asn)/glutamyl-tRNA(Gln) amidotransferase subunit B
MERYDIVIGLEVHAQLLTATKVWCGCPTTFGDKPNTNVCPICVGMPGPLPVLNRRALFMAVMAGLALDCRINPESRFSRKNYFYPDLTKGYQITQLDRPVAQEGHLDIDAGAGLVRVGINRIQIEEDAGKSMHLEGLDYSLVDYNRCGVPLIEIVSEPHMHSVEEAVEYLKTLRQILMYLGVCDGNMEQGSFRCDANVSLKPKGLEKLGVRTEMKNLNSFRFVQKGLEYEIERHATVLDAGACVVQETLLFDPDSGKTQSMRGKEESHDYRYFPEPDLVPITADEALLNAVRAATPELPGEKRRRFIETMGLSAYDATVLCADQSLANYFEEALATYPNAKKICNWLTTDLLGKLNKDGIDIRRCTIRPADLAALVLLVEDKKITGRQAKEIFDIQYASGRSPAEIISGDSRYKPVDEDAVRSAASAIVAASPKEVEAYRGGKEQLLGFFIGQLMKATKGAAPSDLAQRIMKELLKG